MTADDELARYALQPASGERPVLTYDVVVFDRGLYAPWNLSPGLPAPTHGGLWSVWRRSDYRKRPRP